MSTLAILPIKSFADAKQRLADELAPGARRALAEAMFSDVLVALRRAQGIDEVLVVSNDNGAQQIAGGYGAQVLDDLQEGHNPAALLGIRWALDAGIDRALLVPGDCPMLVPAEIDELCAHPVAAPSALIVPDRHGTGTNALLLTPPDTLAPSFGPDSCRRHAANAESAGISSEIVDVPSLALDVDTFEDLTALNSALADSHGGAAHTRGMLRQLTRSRAQ
jgi:2-phospho-L-lactate/phosphoenolpyruvate guanylyltransferase